MVVKLNERRRVVGGRGSGGTGISFGHGKCVMLQAPACRGLEGRWIYKSELRGEASATGRNLALFFFFFFNAHISRMFQILLLPFHRQGN